MVLMEMVLYTRYRYFLSFSHRRFLTEERDVFVYLRNLNFFLVGEINKIFLEDWYSENE